MSTLEFHTLDVFTERRFGGNPLAVVLAADGLPTARMQQIAREFNLSETVFLQSAGDPRALFRARIFTPAAELPFAGHPTVGTACLLVELGLAGDGTATSFVLEEGVGLVPVKVRREAGYPPFGELTAAKIPESGPAPPPVDAIAAVLGLAGADLSFADERPRTASGGVPFVLVPLRVPELLAAVDFDVARWKSTFEAGWARQLFVYARGYEGELRARMFGPGVGVLEDPATGSAAVALAGVLAKEDPTREGTLSWTIVQGVEMGRPSVLHARADKRGGEVVAVRVGGHAVRVSRGTIEADG